MAYKFLANQPIFLKLVFSALLSSIQWPQASCEVSQGGDGRSELLWSNGSSLAVPLTKKAVKLISLRESAF